MTKPATDPMATLAYLATEAVTSTMRSALPGSPVVDDPRRTRHLAGVRRAVARVLHAAARIVEPGDARPVGRDVATG